MGTGDEGRSGGGGCVCVKGKRSQERFGGESRGAVQGRLEPRCFVCSALLHIKRDSRPN